MEEETEYEQSQTVRVLYPLEDRWETSLWDDFCASVTDGCDDED